MQVFAQQLVSPVQRDMGLPLLSHDHRMCSRGVSGPRSPTSPRGRHSVFHSRGRGRHSCDKRVEAKRGVMVLVDRRFIHRLSIHRPPPPHPPSPPHITSLPCPQPTSSDADEIWHNALAPPAPAERARAHTHTHTRVSEEEKNDPALARKRDCAMCSNRGAKGERERLCMWRFITCTCG